MYARIIVLLLLRWDTSLQLRVRNQEFIFFYFSTKTYVIGTQKNRLNETVLLSTQKQMVKLMSKKILTILRPNFCLSGGLIRDKEMCQFMRLWYLSHISVKSLTAHAQLSSGARGLNFGKSLQCEGASEVLKRLCVCIGSSRDSLVTYVYKYQNFMIVNILYCSRISNQYKLCWRKTVFVVCKSFNNRGADRSP